MQHASPPPADSLPPRQPGFVISNHFNESVVISAHELQEQDISHPRVRQIITGSYVHLCRDTVLK